MYLDKDLENKGKHRNSSHLLAMCLKTIISRNPDENG